MRIPKRFRLLGHEWTVEIVPQSKWEDPEAIGLCEVAARRIRILKGDRETMLQVYWHECYHAMFATMGREKLYRDEPLVDMLASMTHQILSSAE